MTELLYSSEKIGCGATVKLNSGDICMVSVARSGVLVKSSRGAFGQLLISLFGSVLYSEKNVYKAAETAIALDALFPENVLPKSFNNVILTAFANAIWQCPTAAQVAIILNEATTRVEKQINNDRDVISDLAALMENGGQKADVFYDVSVLPHPKDEILRAIEREIIREPLEERVRYLTVGAMFLTHFQEGIGRQPLFWVGTDLQELDRTTPDLREQAKIIADSPNRERAQHYLKIMNIEVETLSARLDAAHRLRNIRNGRFAFNAMSDNALDDMTLDAEALFQKGNSYIAGRDVPENDVEAAKWYRKAAEQGHAEAQAQLGLMYIVGQGVPQDFAAAAQWCRKAADQGIARAQAALGDMYIKAQGVPKNYVEAAKWCRKAAEQDNGMAQLLLGAMYHNGEGVPKDYVQAYMWTSLAASKSPAGPENRAIAIRDVVASKMTQAEIERAQNSAQRWKPKTN